MQLILLFLGATEAEVCDVLGVAAAFAVKQGGHRHSSDDICHLCKVTMVQDFGKSDIENEWNSRKSPAADMRSGSLAIRSSTVSKALLFQITLPNSLRFKLGLLVGLTPFQAVL